MGKLHPLGRGISARSPPPSRPRRSTRYLQKSESSAGFNRNAASDWSVVIISTLPFSLTGSRGEYLMVVGILEMVE